MRAEAGEPKRTPLFGRHVSLGAKMTEFAGWQMPLSYRGILEEHRSVRTKAGLFDVSHMGEIAVRGPGAAELCQRLGTNDVGRLSDGGVQYTLLCDENGGVIDDVTLYRLFEDEYFFCVNAANIAKDFEWIESHAGAVVVEDMSAETALLSLQGPAAEEVLSRAARLDLADLPRFRFLRTDMEGCSVTVSRTGYTGEDGFEIFLESSRALTLWDRLMEEGRAFGVVPVGLGARDTLRLEAALPLYGHELSSATTPLEAGLERFVRFDAGDFIGRERLLEQKRTGCRRRLIGLVLVDRGVARHGYAVVVRGEVAGEVTSGGWSPTLGRSIALAYLDTAALGGEGEVEVAVPQGRAKAKLVSLPFYRREGRSRRP